MKTKVVSHTPTAIPYMERERLARLAALPDESIDTGDIPELSDEAWSARIRGRFYRALRRRIIVGRGV